jgi:hypothetical protein
MCPVLTVVTGITQAVMMSSGGSLSTSKPVLLRGARWMLAALVALAAALVVQRRCRRQLAQS